MVSFKIKLLSSLEKVFPDKEPLECPALNKLTVLKNDIVSFQLAYMARTFYITDRYFRMEASDAGLDGEKHGQIRPEEKINNKIRIKIDSGIKEHIRIRKVGLLPSNLPAYSVHDDNYLCTQPGLFPDILNELEEDHTFSFEPDQWRSLWVDVEPYNKVKAGIYPVRIDFMDRYNRLLCSKELKVEVLDAVLTEQELIHTEWFHCDCLANYYNVDVFSEEFWQIVENFIETAVSRGINMILTPLFTPPLDTRIGGERLTVQLIDVYCDNDEYSFDFDRLKYWIDLCKKAGVQYFEMSHLFTQWGAKAVPKIMAEVDGEYKKLFGWETPAVSNEYKKFLDCFLPQLTKKLKQWDVDKYTYFHISDEPRLDDLEAYSAARKLVSEHLKDFNIIDALSNYEFYDTGALKRPIPKIDHIEKFIENKVPKLWTYYCCGQVLNVSNRFMSMPSARNRIIGVQMYKYEIEGFLHWGYNFYNSRYSTESINPYAVTDANCAFPSGDTFLVYPGKKGEAVESIRMMVFYNAINDLRAMKLLESLTDRDFVMELIEGELNEPVTFSKYPKTDMYLINLRNKINKEIIKAGIR